MRYKIIIKDEVWARIEGVPPEVWGAVIENLKVLATGHQYMLSFKQGLWDGYKHFAFTKVSRSKTTGQDLPAEFLVYARLLRDRVIPILREHGYTGWKTVDTRPRSIELPRPIDDQYMVEQTGMRYPLRPYQVEAVNAVIERNSGILNLATGAGKTLVCATLCRVYSQQGLTCLVVVPNIQLLSQTHADFASYGVKAGRIGDGFEEFEGNNVIVATWQTLKNKVAIMAKFQMVCWDEFHSGTAPVAQELLNDHGKHIRYRFGCTGTMPKELDFRMQLSSSMGEVLCTKTARELIDEGYLSELNITPLRLSEYAAEVALPHLLDKTSMKKMKADEREAEAARRYKWEREFIAKDFCRLEAIAKVLVTLNRRHGNMLVMVTDIAFGKRLAKLIPKAVFLYGEDDVEAREKQYARYATEDDVITIVNQRIASTGLSIVRIFCVALVDVQKSFTTTIQSIGRGLRKSLDKDYVDVYDIHSGLPSAQKQLKERLTYYREAEYPVSGVQELQVQYAEPPPKKAAAKTMKEKVKKALNPDVIVA